MAIRALKSAQIAGTALAAALALATAATAPAPVSAQVQITETQSRFVVDADKGKLITLPRAASDVFVAEQRIADVSMRSPRQLYIFGKEQGVTSFFATDAAGKVIYSAELSVIGNTMDISNVNNMLRLAMPEADIRVNQSGNFILLTGTINNPADIVEAEDLVQAYVGDNVRVVSRLKTATPVQVALRVRFAEVSRSLAKEINGNIATRDNTGGFLFGLSRGRNFATIGDADLSGFPQLDASGLFGLPPGSIDLPFNPATGQFITGAGTQYTFNNPTNISSVQAAGRLFGLDIATAFDVSERLGLVSTLAEPTLTTVSGETATFQAGGRFPIPIASALGNVSVTYENYGISLEYTPTVMANGRISIKVAPEVSELTSDGAVRISGLEIPAISTRQAETTVELGSGESFMIAGLLQNNWNSSLDKTPGLADMPILGNLFKSDGFRRRETELMIVITPYLVNPISDSEIVLPTDGFKAPNEVDRLLLNRQHSGTIGGDRPKPSVAPPVNNGPAISSMPADSDSNRKLARRKSDDSSAAPGFSFD